MLLEVLRVPRAMMNEVSNREFLGRRGPLAFIFDEEIPGIVHFVAVHCNVAWEEKL